MYFEERANSYDSNYNFSIGDNDVEDICGKLLSKLDTKTMLQLKSYFKKFKKESVEEIDSESLKIDEGNLINALNKIFGTSEYNLEAMKLFKILDFDEINYVTWEQFSDYYVLHNIKKYSNNFTNRHLKINESNIDIRDIDHCKKETIFSIITIETKMFFCYIIISKHGKIGIYDGKINLLVEYDVFFIRTGVNKRVRDIWITAAIYLSDIQYLIITASDKSIMIYDASTLCHTPVFLITGLANIPTCFSYMPSESKTSKSYLVMGDDLGGLTTFILKQPQHDMFFRKNPDKLTTYFWIELQGSINEPFCKIKFNRRVHSRPVKKIMHVSRNKSIISCSGDPKASIVIQHAKKIMEPYTFVIPRGVTCFNYSEELNLLVTGGADRRVRLWEPVVTSHPSAIFPLQSNKIMDVVILAHLNVILSFNKNGVLIMWDIFKQTCVQSVNIRFPSFGVLGRPIQFGTQSLYHGPARANAKKSNHLKNSAESNGHNGHNMYNNVWQRPELIVTCCNHLVIIPMGDGSILDLDVTIEKGLNESTGLLSLLPPPEKNHRPKRPITWNDDPLDSLDEIGKQIDSMSDLKFDESTTQFDNEMRDYTKEIIFPSVEELLHRNGLSGILEKDFLSAFGQKQNLNEKIVMHQSKTKKMQLSISQGAPFTALDLQHHEDIKFSKPLPLSNRMKKKSGLEHFHDPQQILKYDSCFSMDSPKSEYTVFSNKASNSTNV